ncbi:DUF2884 family protein [Dyella subtropica]|uniref:DUF2884 family protein n=1 Tax=Dyella subtropica TaxID=2992127 RepID=UPI00224D7B01|nr:DUF2884 family protein [Dyella subtropica]
MRTTFTAITLALGLVLGAPAQAREIHINHPACGYDTPYNLQVDDSGIRFDRESGMPGKVFMHDGFVRVDGRDLAVSADDAVRLRQYETSVRALLPEVAGVARDGVDIGFTAMRAVMMTFAENESERRQMVGRLDERRAQALAQIDGSLGHGVWKHDAISDVVADSIQDSVSELVSKVTAGAVKAALSGDQSKVAALQARADTLDKTIDKEVNARADKLEVRARALCPRLQALEQLQQQFQFRLADGSRLELMTHDKDEQKKATTGKEPKVALR